MYLEEIVVPARHIVKYKLICSILYVLTFYFLQCNLYVNKDDLIWQIKSHICSHSVVYTGWHEWPQFYHNINTTGQNKPLTEVRLIECLLSTKISSNLTLICVLWIFVQCFKWNYCLLNLCWKNKSVSNLAYGTGVYIP